MTSKPVTIEARFCGPPQSANGGYTAGLLADLIDGPAEVTLRAPPPLEVPLQLERESNGRVVLRAGSTLLAEAIATAVDVESPEPVTFAEAERASLAYTGFKFHPFPTCFVCGPARARGDGLALFPGPVGARPLVASPWMPGTNLCSDGTAVDARFLWAALDCPSWFGFSTFATDTLSPSLLGRLRVSIARKPRLDEPCIVAGWALGREGRRIECASAVFDSDGDCLARATATWITLKVAENP